MDFHVDKFLSLIHANKFKLGHLGKARDSNYSRDLFCMPNKRMFTGAQLFCQMHLLDLEEVFFGFCNEVCKMVFQETVL